ncbi:hypothetical protein FALBO_2769 [Fusarium albosuccineum]|uniref:Casein kinase II beta 2 subunit n=1 Tax=Fusarium albosuccineum TaxID=1237068 RepID=A0A8H4LJI8_9HYPO|nr:hypothetical protein FALBO_2769 [Fusarium albosuccineum]
MGGECGAVLVRNGPSKTPQSMPPHPCGGAAEILRYLDVWRILSPHKVPPNSRAGCLALQLRILLFNCVEPESTRNLRMASLEALWGPMARRLLRVAVAKTTNVVRTKLVLVTRPLQTEFHHLTLKTARVARQPIHPVAALRQQKRHAARWFSSSAAQNVNRVVRRFISSEPKAARFDRSKLPVSNTSRRVAQFSGRAPFANALRPNLTGGAIPRTAGGYSIGGGARYFSHGPAAPAQVVQNVSQAMRAFFLSGQKLRYDGLGPRGDRQYRGVSPMEDAAMNKFSSVPHTAPGSFIDFKLSPTVTALSPLAAAIPFASETTGFKAEAAAAGASLNTEGFLDVLSTDFGRALKDLTAIYADLRRLAILGDLPVLLEKHNTLRVRFPGVDAETIERLCDDIGIERGIVGQDPNFDVAAGVPMALQFPFAPDTAKSALSPTESVRSVQNYDFEQVSTLDDDDFVREAFMDEMAENPWLAETMSFDTMSPPASSIAGPSEDYEGLEGIYKFLEECDRAKGRVGQVN